MAEALVVGLGDLEREKVSVSGIAGYMVGRGRARDDDTGA